MTLYDSHTLSLYCDNTDAIAIPSRQEALPGQHHWGEFPALFEHQSEVVCRRRAKTAGWKFFPDGRNLCPRCAAAGIKLRKQ